jgi:tetratricopeptide (TPR) repeat protein
MSGRRRDPHKSRLRRDRIRREKHLRQVPASPPPMPDPVLEHAFAAERALRQVQSLLEGQRFGSIEEANARLADLTQGGRLSEMADAWKRDDPKWRAQELAYDALETDDFVEALRLVNEALKLDRDCTDAQRLMVSLLPATAENRLLLMREVVSTAERNLGERCFEENAGHFWGIISTRPYMRAKQHLAELLVETGKPEEAIPVLEHMLELNPNDNQGMRYPLLAQHLAAGRVEDARRLFSRYPGEEKYLASFAWARVLERWLSGAPAEAGKALERAREVNPFVERYLSGARPFPREAPACFRPGEESEAQICAHQLVSAWEAHPVFRDWLRAQQ